MENNFALLTSVIFYNFPFIMTGLAVMLGIITTTWYKRDRACSDIFLSRLMFFAVGLAGLWGFVVHVFFPMESTKFIGWVASPFEFEVGVANLGMGIAGIFGVRASRGYWIATTLFTTGFLWGAAFGHVYQMMATHNFAPGNAGTIFYNDIIMPLFLIIFLCCKNCCKKSC